MQGAKKTRVMSFRLDEALIGKLSTAARHAHMTENASVSALLEDRLTIYPLIPAFQEIRLATVTFEPIVNATNIDALEATASDMAQKNFRAVRELFRSNGITLTFQVFVMDLLGKYGRWFYLEGDPDWSQGWITLRHQFGLKWSRFLRAYLLSAYSTVSKDKLKTEIDDQFVRISFAVAWGGC
jgi:hypothetical protein